MKGINRRSQKVRCIAEFELIDTTSGRTYQGPIPQIEEVYTVGDFADCNGLVDENNVDLSEGKTVPGIVLIELKSPTGRKPDGSRGPIGWPIVGFEPLVEGEQDISALVEAARTAKASDFAVEKYGDQADEPVTVDLRAGTVTYHHADDSRVEHLGRWLEGEPAECDGSAWDRLPPLPMCRCALPQNLEKVLQTLTEQIAREMIRKMVIPWILDRLREE